MKTKSDGARTHSYFLKVRIQNFHLFGIIIKVQLRYYSVFKRSFIISALIASAVTTAHAQYDVSFSHYFDLEPSFNAAAVGKQSKLNIAAAYAIELAGFEHNPNTMFASADMPVRFLGALHGVGLQFVNDKIGLFSHQRITLQYAYKHDLFGGTISAGINAGLLSESFDGSKAEPGETGDPALATSKVDGNGLDLGAGLYYSHRNWYVGLSATHLNSPLIELGERNELMFDPTYYFTAGYDIKLRNPFLTVKTSALGRTDGVAWRADVTGRLVYTNEKKVMYAGLTYSPTTSVTLLIGGSVHGVMLGYSYEYYTSAISFANGGHELFIGYQVDLNMTKKGKNKHKSVRIL